jgi:hypothetical protein
MLSRVHNALTQQLYRAVTFIRALTALSGSKPIASAKAKNSQVDPSLPTLNRSHERLVSPEFLRDCLSETGPLSPLNEQVTKRFMS